MVFSLFRKTAHAAIIKRLHGEIVAASRQTAFYQHYGVSDTFEGRLELLILHAWLLLGALKQHPDLARDLADAIFAGLDADLREMGVGDSAVAKRIGRMLEAFTGRCMAYDQALEQSREQLAIALARNVLAGQGDGGRLARYAGAAAAALAQCDLDAILARPLPFPHAALLN